jgi:hypothetical protein
MNMRTLGIVFASFLVAALGSGAAHATVTNLVESGTGANITASSISADGCVEYSLSLDPATSITRGNNGGTSAGMQIILFRDDFCNSIFEFGFTTVNLTNEFQTGPGNNSATLNATVTIQTFDFDGNVHDRVIVANVQLQGTSDNTAGVTSSRFVNGKFRSVSNGHSVSTIADVTGQISVDGQSTLPDGAGSIETSMNVFVTITQ